MPTMSADADTTWLYLIRHGATAANERRPYILQGRGLNGSLSERGRRQAAAVSQLLSTVALDAVYASPLLRATETARAIAQTRGLAVATREELTECDVGAWEGMDWDSIKQAHPEAYRAFHDDPATAPYLGGETYRDVQSRVLPAIKHLLEQHAGHRIAAVAHNVVNRAYLASLLGIDLRRAKDLQQANGGVNVIRRRGEVTELVTLNAQFHLAEDLR
jgi:broad specificity phosphatase PhoE